ncbi:hypothetical protein F4555_002027 [Mobiluncus mulieris]|uniref:hypothetical protein n=1 Tax=Mobiluncus mulieris TaxID=2052 RepID=UPI0002D581DD|nr:hypothetical protein [Mobiluncus mulieris]MBB5847231.1 hypothetical protein [Mobiluncus mulieris]MCV0011360.1 hypothetical protein [Mobiluncus mulieris]NMW81372.1 hypothetical protein [Mobiluncus mulieris]
MPPQCYLDSKAHTPGHWVQAQGFRLQIIDENGSAGHKPDTPALCLEPRMAPHEQRREAQPKDYLAQ